VTTKNGAGHGILCTLKGAPCVLTPAHVLGEAEDEPHPGLFDRRERETRVSAASRALVFVAHRLAGDGTVNENEVAVTRLRLLPEVFFAFSPAPQTGRPPDANRMDYALCACDVETHTSETEGDDSQNTLSAVSSSKRADFKKRTRAALFTRALEDAQPSETCEPGDELHLGACVGKETRVSDVAWRRGFVTAPPRRRRDDEAYPYAAGLGDTAASRGARATRVSLRYDARTVSGESGAAVTSAPRRAFGELDADFAARRKAAHALGSRGRGALVAMHRAGGEGEDGEGVMVCEILRDVKETLAVGKVRDAAEEGNAAVAVAELAREPRTSSRGARSRAAAAAGGGRRARARRARARAHAPLARRRRRGRVRHRDAGQALRERGGTREGAVGAPRAERREGLTFSRQEGQSCCESRKSATDRKLPTSNEPTTRHRPIRRSPRSAESSFPGAHTAARARDERGRVSRARCTAGLCRPAGGTGSGPCPWARRAFCC
jgi:hypothetical protein